MITSKDLIKVYGSCKIAIDYCGLFFILNRKSLPSSHDAVAHTTPHIAPPRPPHGPLAATGLQMDSPMVPPHRHQPYRGMGPRTRTPMVIHHDTHLAPPEPQRNLHPLQPVRTGQNKQTRTPLPSTPPLLPHTGTTAADPHMPPPEPGDSLRPPLHILLPHTGTKRDGTHRRLPSRTANHLQRNRGLRHPDHTAHDPNDPPHHRPRLYTYVLMNPCRLPQPSPADLIFFTDASGKSALTPITRGATLQLTYTTGQYHMDHYTGHTTGN